MRPALQPLCLSIAGLLSAAFKQPPHTNSECVSGLQSSRHATAAVQQQLPQLLRCPAAHVPQKAAIPAPASQANLRLGCRQGHGFLQASRAGIGHPCTLLHAVLTSAEGSPWLQMFLSDPSCSASDQLQRALGCCWGPKAEMGCVPSLPHWAGLRLLLPGLERAPLGSERRYVLLRPLSCCCARCAASWRMRSRDRRSACRMGSGILRALVWRSVNLTTR
jgi:hypothetical protein